MAMPVAGTPSFPRYKTLKNPTFLGRQWCIHRWGAEASIPQPMMAVGAPMASELSFQRRCEVKHGQGGDGSIGSKWSPFFWEKGLGLERHQVAMPVTSMPVASVQTGVPMSDDSLGNPRLKEWCWSWAQVLYFCFRFLRNRKVFFKILCDQFLWTFLVRGG